MTANNPKPRRVCFSYAAYAKNLIHHLKSADIPVEQGLSDVEISALESDFRFTFPPDLRSILREGLPVGPGFPNWRSSSRQQLEIIINLPVLGLCKQVSRGEFWMDSWGEMPEDTDMAVSLANKVFTKTAPLLVPIYRHFYIPSSPCLAGNPVLYVHGGEVEIRSFDIAGFFQTVEFTRRDDAVFSRPSLPNLPNPPAWAATEARRIEFWTELVEARGNYGGGGRKHRRWWSEDLEGWVGEVVRRLRDGGWKEEDVREMMMMDGCDQFGERRNGGADIEGLKLLSKILLRAGWSTEDVVDSLGSSDDYHFDLADSYFDFHQGLINGFDENTE
nr:ATP-dependent 6-phosphofructokinase [Ipomoea batatas]